MSFDAMNYYNELAFREYQQRRDAVGSSHDWEPKGGPDNLRARDDQFEMRPNGHSDRKGDPGPPVKSQAVYRGNPVDYSMDAYRPGDAIHPNPIKQTPPQVGQPNGFIPNRGPAIRTCNVPPTSGAMASLVFTIDRLHEKIRELRSRLAPVLSPCGPDNDGCAGAAIPERSELTEGIMANARSIEGANAIIADLLTRLEV